MIVAVFLFTSYRAVTTGKSSLPNDYLPFYHFNCLFWILSKIACSACTLFLKVLFDIFFCNLDTLTSLNSTRRKITQCRTFYLHFLYDLSSLVCRREMFLAQIVSNFFPGLQPNYVVCSFRALSISISVTFDFLIKITMLSYKPRNINYIPLIK